MTNGASADGSEPEQDEGHDAEHGGQLDEHRECAGDAGKNRATLQP